jgi:hypothetical protein
LDLPTAYAELCQIFALLQVWSDRTAGPQARPGRTKRCELEDYVKKTNHKRFSINDFYAALFITSGLP